MAGIDPPPQIVAQLRAAIRASGLNLVQLGTAANVDPGQLSRFLRGERGLTLDSAGLVCQALGIKLDVPDELQAEEVESSPPPPTPRPRKKK